MKKDNLDRVPTDAELATKIAELVEQQKKTDEQLREFGERLGGVERILQQKKTDRQLDDLDIELDEEERVFGDMTEHVSWKNLERLLAEQAGIVINGTTERFERKYEGRGYEVDLLAVGNRDIVAVEVKTTLRVKDVKKLSSIMLKFTKIFPEYARHENIYGGVAYMKAHDGTEEMARSRGLLTIQAIGKSAQVVGLDDRNNLRNFRKVD